MNDDIWKDLEVFSKSTILNLSTLYSSNFRIQDEKIITKGYTFTLEEFFDLVYYYKDKNKRLYQFLKSKYPEYFI